MKSLRKLFNKINIDGEILFNEPLNLHSTFKIGGKADVYIKSGSVKDIIKIKKLSQEENIPLYPLGEGANVLFSDNGYRGIILDTSLLDSIHFEEPLNTGYTAVSAEAGVKMSSLAGKCVEKGLKGLENFYGMPGYVGGSIYMNARCYGVSLSERIISAAFVDSSCTVKKYKYCKDDFDYKKSPFQNKDAIILSALFSLEKGETPELAEKMYSYKEERTAKGHYLYPCAGSVFKNNRDFGEPAGKIIDRLGLRGYSLGGAMISEKHANIIVNKGNASEKDIKELIDFISRKVFEAFGFKLEREIIYVNEEEK